MKPQSFEPLTPNIVLGVAAHPDDLDFGAGGSLAAFAAAGAAVHYLQLTDGCKGTSDRSLTNKQVAEMRRQEQQQACEIIGGQSVQFLDHCDGELAVTPDVVRDIVRAIRNLKPDIVMTTDPTFAFAASYGIINHADHRAAGQATLDAVYPFARDHLAFTELLSEGLEPHKVTTLLLTTFEHPNYFVDISKTLNKKMEAMRAHASQVADPAAFAAILTSMAKTYGEQAECDYAEAFVRIDITI